MRSTDRRSDDLKRCRAILRTGSRSFYVASALLPPRVRGPATALYAFCRVADEAVDGQGARPGAIEALRDRLDRAYTGRPLDNPVDRAFSDVLATYPVPRAVPEALLEGFLWDLDGRCYQTLTDVQAYAARVGATVGVMMATIMGVRDRNALSRACDLGVAMQVTNIARDVGEDARRGRLYLPRAWLDEAGIDPDEWLRAPRFTPPLAAVVKRLLAEAERLYARARTGLHLVPLNCRPAIKAALLIYADIGRSIARVGFDSVRYRAFTTRRRKVVLVLKALRPETPAGAPTLTVLPARFLVEAFDPPRPSLEHR